MSGAEAVIIFSYKKTLQRIKITYTINEYFDREVISWIVLKRWGEDC